MATGSRLHADPLFQGLARPTMIMGVSYGYFTLNAMMTTILYIDTKSFYAPLVGVVLHFFGFLLCMKEPRMVELWMLRLKYGFLSWNRFYHHNTNSYDVF